MKLRYAAAILIGMVAGIGTGIGLFRWTDMELGKVIMMETIAYVGVMIGVLWITGPKKQQLEIRKHKEPKFYTLSPKDYYHLEEVDDGCQAG